ncbi:MAG: tRNA dihydrouridine(20/20a) synthase DusA [Gammaproteobacteria bacterium]|nr:tRNA dihydrouridine(20/20a) synthase DusA [Pseudomonadota bacterium]MCH9663313.1 tRNA dihydrouridine(20/20a) synthase DusA [Gammaproteobacteria bacterium]
MSSKRFHAPVLSVAPMMGYTDRYLRYLLRYLSPHSWLYTEMISSGAVVRPGAPARLKHHICEHPLVLQIGGGCPEELAQAARAAVEAGYKHLNLNAGCPSDKVQNAGIGACLLKQPTRLRECAQALRVPGADTVSVKTRIGVDDLDSYERCRDLAADLHSDGCDFLILHARKAWLNGLSPAQNRSVPPLDHERVYRVQEELSSLPVIINGGLMNWADCEPALARCAGVMLGRVIVKQPLLLMEIEHQLWGTPKKSLAQIFAHYFAFLTSADAGITPQSRGAWSRAAGHLCSLIKGTPSASRIRRLISQCDNMSECAQLCQQYADEHSATPSL